MHQGEAQDVRLLEGTRNSGGIVVWLGMFLSPSASCHVMRPATAIPSDGWRPCSEDAHGTKTLLANKSRLHSVQCGTNSEAADAEVPPSFSINKQIEVGLGSWKTRRRRRWSKQSGSRMLFSTLQLIPKEKASEGSTTLRNDGWDHGIELPLLRSPLSAPLTVFPFLPLAE